jgi:transcriptional regulator with XRE-family HTH domain
LKFCSEIFTTSGVTSPPDESPETEALLARLRSWLSQQRGRQTQIAAYLGVSRSTVTEWLKGRSKPTWETGKKLEKFLKSQRARKAPKPKESQQD